MRRDVEDAVLRATGSRVASAAGLGGGCIGDVYRVTLEDRRQVVVKAGDGDCGLDLEGWMLSYLAENSELPVPEVLSAEPDVLVMSLIETSGGLDAGAQHHAAELLAALHGVTTDRYGLERATLIGGLHQPNPWNASWIEFFRDQRLLYMGNEALRAGRLPAGVMRRLETICGRITTWIEEPEAPSLLHGDMWTGNVLCHRGRISGFVDPAIYYGDPEIELAFSTLFGTYGEPFFRRYDELRPLRPGFFEERRDLYNLYPLLVHVRLFGGSYVGSVEKVLGKFGC